MAKPARGRVRSAYEYDGGRSGRSQWLPFSLSRYRRVGRVVPTVWWMSRSLWQWWISWSKTMIMRSCGGYRRMAHPFPLSDTAPCQRMRLSSFRSLRRSLVNCCRTKRSRSGYFPEVHSISYTASERIQAIFAEARMRLVLARSSTRTNDRYSSCTTLLVGTDRRGGGTRNLISAASMRSGAPTCGAFLRFIYSPIPMGILSAAPIRSDSIGRTGCLTTNLGAAGSGTNVGKTSSVASRSTTRVG